MKTIITVILILLTFGYMENTQQLQQKIEELQRKISQIENDIRDNKNDVAGIKRNPIDRLVDQTTRDAILKIVQDGAFNIAWDRYLITWNSSGVAATILTGTSGQVLTSNGAGAAPTFQDAGSGGGIATLISRCSTNVTQSDGITGYISPVANVDQVNQWKVNTTNTESFKYTFPFDCTILGLAVKVTSNNSTGGDVFVFTIQKNDSDTGIAVTLTGGGLSGSDTGSVAISAGDTITIKLTSDSGSDVIAFPVTTIWYSA